MPSFRADSVLRSSRELLAEMAALPAWSRVLAGIFLICAMALAIPRGGPIASMAALLCVALVTALAWKIAEPQDRRWVLLWSLLAITGREVLVGVVDVALLSRGNVWYAPDEHVYIDHARSIWQHWLDPAAPYTADPYTTSWYVHGMARLYQLLGSENLVVVKVINTSLAVISGLLGYRVMRNLGMPGARWALVLLLAFPSVAFWSALTLKDAYVVVFLMTSLWAASEFARGRSPLWLAVALVALEPLENVRLYMLATGALALLAVPFALRHWRDRLFSGAGLVVGVYVMFAIVQPFKDLGPNVFWIPIELRGAVAQGARSAFVDAKPVIDGQPGQQFRIAVVSGATPAPGVTPRIVIVEPGTAIVVEPAEPATPAASAPAPAPGHPTPAVVRPGDIVQIATPRPSPTQTGIASPSAAASATSTPSATIPPPTPAPVVVTIEPDAKNTVGLITEVDPDQGSFQGSLATNIRHLPIGITYTLLAPFPWTARTGEQLATIPEMFIWYACLMLALLGFLVLLRRRDLRYAHGVAMIIGLTIVLSLISANVGTLIRSRAMLIPYVLLLTGVGIAWLLERYPRFVGRWRSLLTW
jgi:hypothetical protein